MKPPILLLGCGKVMILGAIRIVLSTLYETKLLTLFHITWKEGIIY